MKPVSLRARRDEMATAYARARRQHRGQGRAADRLFEATTALLKAELRQTKPRRGRPPVPRPVAPDLFATEARP